jgi:low affinity Fe/Cu permease
MTTQQKNQDFFTRFTSNASSILGRAWMFIGAVTFLLLWALTGPLLGFSDTWQLIVNTTTTIVTFLMVFIIQNTQNRDNLAIQIKLDALLKKENIDSQKLLEAENLSDTRLEKDQQRAQRKGSKPKK